ncbi:trigger factor [Solibaculum mannosilyticum]|uniref:trigger factor n=1 Tax=Solibaculum mannosilyticum TaxID=2780922 RepID=UPI0007A84EE1|nr:Trigger factor [Eubacteriaceae bacterium CHKCI005]
MSLKSVNKVETNRYQLEVEIPGSVFEEALEKAYRRNISRFNVPGFRKGKAPRAFVEKIYGQDVFYEDAINSLYPDAMEQAVEESKLEIIQDHIDFELVQADKEALIFKATITTKPEVEVGEYKGLKADRVVVPVTEEMIDNELKKLQERNGRIVEVEDRAAAEGDNVVIDFEGFVDGEAFEGGKAEDQPLTLGSGQFIPGFEDQIIGHNAGDEFDVEVTFPEKYHAENLAGKEALFKVKLHEVKTRELPEIDDEFVKDVSEFDTLDELRADIKEKLESEAVREGDNMVEDQVVNQLIDALQAEIPNAMFERRIDDNIRNFEARLRGQGMDVNTYLQYTGMQISALRESMREQSERQVKLRLCLEKIVEKEGIAVTDERLEEEFQKMAEAYNMPIERVKNLVDANDLRGDIAVQQALDLIKGQAVITDLTPEDLKKKQESEKAAEETKEAPVETAEESAAKEEATEEKPAEEKPAPKKRTRKPAARKTTAKAKEAKEESKEEAPKAE